MMTLNLQSRKVCQRADCGKTVPSGKRVDAKYCSKKCMSVERTRRHRARHPELKAVAAEQHVQYASDHREELNELRRTYNGTLTGKMKLRASNLKKYGLTLEQYDAMLTLQGGACAVCEDKKPGGRGRFHVDHNHATGKVRGLLCHGCNTGSKLTDNPTLLRKKADYLERTNG